MAVTDYIAIRGFSASGSEVFQGIGAGSSSETTATPNRDPGVPDVYEPPITSTPISEDPELAEGIWQGQNEKLEHESKYCDQLQAMFKKKQERITGIWDKLLDVAQEVIGGWLGFLVSGWVFLNTGSLELGWLANLLTELGVEWGLEALQSLLTRGSELLDGIKAENGKLLQIEKSRENYEYREQVLARHREDIKIILEQIRMAEKSIELNTQLEMKALLERLTDLALREDTVEIGNTKFHTHGKVLNYK